MDADMLNLLIKKLMQTNAMTAKLVCSPYTCMCVYIYMSFFLAVFLLGFSHLPVTKSGFHLNVNSCFVIFIYWNVDHVSGRHVCHIAGRFVWRVLCAARRGKMRIMLTSTSSVSSKYCTNSFGIFWGQACKTTFRIGKQRVASPLSWFLLPSAAY